MKCEDPDRTDGSEGDILISVCGSRTKAGGSKSIRYRFSSSSKLCRLNDICIVSIILEKLIEYMGFGDSMFARMKLKEIDGRTPPGVECAA